MASPMVGSTMKPTSRDVTVMPSWQPDSSKESALSALNSDFAPR
jgi:hypothetical protein